MKRYLTKTFLGAAGGLLIAIGAGVLFQPEAFSAANGVVLSDDASQLSEVRAPGGLLLVNGLILLLAVGRDRFTGMGLILTAVVYGTYGLSRLVGLALDGVPSQPLMQAMVIELAVAAIAMILLARSVPPVRSQTQGGRP